MALGHLVTMTRAVVCLPHRPRALEGRDGPFPCHFPSAQAEHPGGVPAHSRRPLVSRCTEFAPAVITAPETGWYGNLFSHMLEAGSQDQGVGRAGSF